MALTRDVPFSQYGEDEATVEAAGNPNIFAFLSRRLSRDETSLYVNMIYLARGFTSITPLHE